MEKVTVSCQHCGGAYKVPPRLIGRTKYCNRKCQTTANARKAAETSPTSIEVSVYSALDGLGLTYHPQYPIGDFLADAYIPSLNVVIECQGDYWHCNPVVYTAGKENEAQAQVRKRDKRKFGYYKKNGYRLIELWESDIKEHGARALLGRALAL